MSAGIASDAKLAEQTRRDSFTLSGIPWEQYVELRDIEANRHVRMHFDSGTLTLSPSSVWRQFDGESQKWVCLAGVPWPLYRQLRESHPGPSVRMSYLAGDLLLMSPSKRHEGLAHLLGLLINHWMLEKGLAVFGAGAATLRRDDLESAVEPDQCFYIQSLSEIRQDLNAPDAAEEPAPDLALEVDVTNFSDRKLAIYASLGVSEVWIWKDGLRVLRLHEGSYHQQLESAVLPGFPVAAVSGILLRGSRNNTEALKEFLTLIRGNSS